MNKCMFIGRITKDLELRQVNINGDNVPVLNFSIAVQGQNDSADFIDCVVWRKQAETIARYLGKGRRIAIEGSLHTRSYDAEKDGVTFKVYKSEILVERFHFCDDAKSSDTSAQPAQAAPVQRTQPNYSVNNNNFEAANTSYANYAPSDNEADMF